MKKYLSIFFMCITFSAFAKKLTNETDSLLINPRSDSSISIKNDKHKLMSLTQQIVQGTYFLPAGEIAYGDGSGLTSSSNFTWDASNKRLRIAPAALLSGSIWGGYTSSLQMGTLSIMEYNSNPQVAIGQNMYFNGTNSVYTANGYASVISMGDGNGNMSFSVYSNGVAGNTLSGTGLAMTIKNNGNVLIGTTSDYGNYKLQVDGKVKATSVTSYENSNGYSELIHTNAASNPEYPRAKFLIYGSNSNYNAGMLIANGQATTTAKDAFLEISSKVIQTDEGATNLIIQQTASGVSRIYNLNREGSTGNLAASGPIQIGSSNNGLYGLTVLGDNKVLINTTDQGDYKLQVGGNSLNKDGTAYFMTSNPSTGPLQVIMPSGDPGAAHIVYRNPSGSHISQSFVFGEGGNAIQKGRIRAGNGGELVFESTGTQYFGYHGLADNTNVRFGGATERMFINGSNGQIRISSLATGGITKMVVTDQNGLLSYQDIPSGSGTVSVTSNQVAFGGTGNLITSNSNLTFDGSTFAINAANLIPSSYAQYKLAVNGNAIFTRVKVKESSQWADYVFEPGYKLSTLKEVEAFIKQHKHLPEVPSASDVKKEGIDIGDNQVLLLKKIEELTLYSIEQEKKNEEQQKEIETLKEQNKEIQELKKEIELIKQLIKK